MTKNKAKYRVSNTKYLLNRVDHNLNKLEITLHDDACFFGQNGFREEF